MTQTLREVMTTSPVTVSADAALLEAARLMKERNIGDVIVTEDGAVRGIVTDRDIVVRAIAEGWEPSATKVGDVCSSGLVALSADDDVDEAVSVMREQAVRRVAITDDATLVGVVSLGDLAVERDPKSALGRISAAPPTS